MIDGELLKQWSIGHFQIIKEKATSYLKINLLFISITFITRIIYVSSSFKQLLNFICMKYYDNTVDVQINISAYITKVINIFSFKNLLLLRFINSSSIGGKEWIFLSTVPTVWVPNVRKTS